MLYLHAEIQVAVGAADVTRTFPDVDLEERQDAEQRYLAVLVDIAWLEREN